MHVNEVCVTEGAVGESPLCLIILVRQVQTQSLIQVFVAWLKANRIQTVCTVVFSHIPICESFCIDRSGCRHQRLGVRTLQNIVSTQLPPSDTEIRVRSRATARAQ